MTRRLLAPVMLLVLALASGVAVFAIVVGVQPTRAAWTSVRTVNVTATAATPAAVPTVKCGGGSGTILSNPLIPITWTAPAGPAPSRYRIHWAGTAGTGDVYSATTSGTINAAGISVAGTSTVTVYAEYGDWTSPVSLQSVSFTTISVLVVVSWSCSPFP